MCDDQTLADDERFGFSRRQFTATGALLAFSGLLHAESESSVTEQDVTITTPDGTADCYFVHPVKGKHPAVLVWPDILGLRPAYRMVGKRLAQSGYSVLVVNPYYRSIKSPAFPEGASFRNPEVRGPAIELARSLSPTTNVTDAKAFVGWLDQQAAVDTKRKIGTTGYCMGGPMTMRTAAALPDRVGAGASFHGGGLVTDKPDSPHLLIPKMQAAYLVAVASNDDEREPDAKHALRKAFDAVDLPAEIEVYDALHGWCSPDSVVYNEAEAERAWQRLLVLLGAL